MASWRDASSEVSGVAVPPSAATIDNVAATKPLEKTIVPFRLHEPPAPVGDSQIVWTTCPATAIRFSALLAKNAIDWPSGDQNGYCPPSVPASGSGVSESIDCSHSCDRPSDRFTVNTIRDPSGEILTGSAKS